MSSGKKMSRQRAGKVIRAFARRYSKRARASRGRRAKSYPFKSISLQSHIFEENVSTHSIGMKSNQITADGNLIATDMRTFRFADLPQAAHYENLFYQYRLLKIIATYTWAGEGVYVPSVNMAVTVGTGSTLNSYPLNSVSPPKLWVQRNHSVTAAIPVQGMATSSKTIKQTLKPGNAYTISLVPSVYDSIQQNVNATPTLVPVPKYKQWLLTNAAGSAVMHFGLHSQVQTYNSNSAINMGEITVNYKYIFECKGNE